MTALRSLMLFVIMVACGPVEVEVYTNPVEVSPSPLPLLQPQGPTEYASVPLTWHQVHARTIGCNELAARRWGYGSRWQCRSRTENGVEKFFLYRDRQRAFFTRRGAVLYFRECPQLGGYTSTVYVAGVCQRLRRGVYIYQY